MFYYLAHYKLRQEVVLDDDGNPTLDRDNYWDWPDSDIVGAIDLRYGKHRTTFVDPGVGFGFFASKTILTLPDAVYLGADINGKLTAQQRADTKKALGLNGIDLPDLTLVDLIYEILTERSDPEVKTAPGSLMPTRKLDMEIWLGGHSLIKTKKLMPGVSPEWVKVQTRVQNEYVASKGTGVDGQLHRKKLSFWSAKYKVDYREFIPFGEPVVTPLPHSTTYQVGFSAGEGYSDGSAIQDHADWSEIIGSADNEIRTDGADQAVYCNRYSSTGNRYEQDVSGDDMYTQMEIQSQYTGSSEEWLEIMTRVQSDATDWYGMRAADALFLYEVTAGSQTQIDTAAETATTGQTIKVEADGSSIKGYEADVEKLSATDTAHTGHTRGGFRCRTSDLYVRPYWDDFEVGDLAGGTEYEKELTETITLTDSIIKDTETTKSETLTLTDTLTTGGTFLKTLSETLSLTDTTPKLITPAAFTETLSLTDSLTNTLVYLKELTETLSLTDTLTRSTSKPLSETLTLTDTLTRVATLLKTLEETLSLTDSILKATSVTKSETLTLTDSLTNTLVFIKELTETLNLTDSIVNTAAYAKELSETLNLTDSLTTQADFARTLTDILTLTDSVLKAVTLAALEETLVLTDSVAPVAVGVVEGIAHIQGASLTEPAAPGTLTEPGASGVTTKPGASGTLIRPKLLP